MPRKPRRPHSDRWDDLSRRDIILASLGVLIFFAFAIAVPFQDKLFNYLFPKPHSHAAAIFDDDFETGDISKWDSNFIEDGNSVTATSSAALNGNYGLDVKTGGSNDDASVTKNIPATNELYVRFHIRLLTNVPDDPSADNIFQAGTSGLDLFTRSYYPALNRLQMDNDYSDPGPSLTPGTWYCVEEHIVVGSGTGRVTAWLDGNQIFDHQNIDTGLTPITSVTLGANGPNGAREYNFDDFAINDADQIGCGATIGKLGPLRSNPAPLGHLPQGTTTTNLTLNTDTASTCRYATQAGVDYTAMTNTFTTTGGTSHSTPVTGLTDGNSYAYYVRCQRASDGQANDDDLKISFYIGIDKIAPQPLSLASTFQSISVYEPFSGDQDQNATPKLEWRKTGTANWNPGTDMTVDRRVTLDTADWGIVNNPYLNQYRASVVGLTPNTSYDIRVTFTDPDGTTGTNSVTATIATRNNVYPLGTGASYYVAPTGSDTNPGTLAAPFKTIQKAANTVKAGDTVYVRGGTYAEQVTIPTSGTADNWITFMPYQNESVTLDGQNTLADGFAMDSVSYIHIKGFHIVNQTSRGVSLNLTDFITLENNDIEGFGDNGVRGGGGYGYSGGSNLVMIGNTIVRTSAPCAGCEGHLVSVWRNNGGNIYDHNTFRDTSGVPRGSAYWDCLSGGSNYALDGGPAPRDSDISNTYFDDCNDDQLELDGGNMNSRVWNNTFKATTNGFTSISTAPTTLGPVYIFRNISYGGHVESINKEGNGNSGAKYFYNNTFYEATGTQDAIEQTNPGFYNIISRNNVWQAGRYILEAYEGGDTFSFDYDALYTSDPTRFVKWNGDPGCCSTFANFQKNTGQEAHGLSFDLTSQFTDPTNGNFALKSNSQLIDKGVILPGFNDLTSAWPYAGNAPDIGALEYGTPNTPPPPTVTPTPTIVPTATPLPANAPQPTATPTIPPALLRLGDTNNDGRVNIIDLSYLLAHWNSTDAKADLNHDGHVTILDLSILLAHWT